jgi:threonine/homoserine/homoserine lactone efflux protein
MFTSMLAFAAFAAVLTITPGVDTLLVLRTTAASGRRAGLLASVGIAMGCLTWAVVSALGVTAVLQASQLAFTVLRLAGAAYLFWLGVRALWRFRRPVEGAEAEPAPSGRALRTGLVTNLLNPKVGAFYLSVLPQFLPHDVNALAGSVALAGVHIVEGTVWLSIVVLGVNRARRLLTRPSVRRRLEQLAGVAFLGFAARLALSQQ